MKKTVFLGGSCRADNKKWRDEYMKLDNVSCFNPWVSNWDAKAQENEKYHREYDTYVLFNLDGPNTFSIAEVVDCSNKRPETTILIIDDKVKKQDNRNKRSLYAIADLVESNGAHVFKSHSEALKFLKSIK